MVGRNVSAIENDIKRGNYADVPNPIMDLMWDLQPYEGGDPLLEAFNKLRNIKTHRMLMPFIYKHGQSVSLSVNPGSGGFHLQQMGGPDTWDQEKQELTLARLGTPPNGIEFKTRFDIVIAGTDIAGKPQPALPFLNATASKFARIVSAIEAETAKAISTDKF